ncbi:MAG TPA: hypothetical protein VMY18_07120, partial [Acidobacteriota bacterium]|nr:hypothetical protein [Acidobacteriota bacterium]
GSPKAWQVLVKAAPTIRVRQDGMKAQGPASVTQFAGIIRNLLSRQRRICELMPSRDGTPVGEVSPTQGS